jgi:hypothetical protein
LVEAGVDGEADLCAAERGKGLAEGNRFGFGGEGSVCQRLKGRRESLKWKESVVAG